jgi:hypothetical protein
MNSREFVFKAKSAMPLGSSSVNLINATYNIVFKPDYIKSYLPFYGTVYNGIGPGGDNGYKFKGKPVEFTITQRKKNYVIYAVIKEDNDVYQISISRKSIGFSKPLNKQQSQEFNFLLRRYIESRIVESPTVRRDL